MPPINKRLILKVLLSKVLGKVSVQTTEGYLGCQQRLRNAVNDWMGLYPAAPAGPTAYWPT